ncbi:hypothetical protein NMY22_g11473 [Coprinellus aureogranulatus]|nr:hypothetical protein NMY22_g11473 [Coprinellus aureogranulatus]
MLDALHRRALEPDTALHRPSVLVAIFPWMGTMEVADVRDEPEGPEGYPRSYQHHESRHNAQPGKKIASLYLESQKQDDQYVLNASEKDATEVYLVPTVPADGAPALPIIEGQEYCATYDPNPPEAEPLTMQRCMTVADDSDYLEAAKDVDAAKDTDPDNHKSQTFSFNPDSGVIRPMWFAGEDDGKTDSASVASDDTTPPSVPSASPSTTAGQSSLPSVSSSAVVAEDTSTPSSSVPSASSQSASAPLPTSTSTITARDSGAQNVTLVFVPSSNPSAESVGDAAPSSVLPVPIPSGSSASTSASPSQTASAASDDSETTATMTTTVTVTAGSPTTTPDATAKDASSDDGASSTTTVTISASALPSPTAASKANGAGSLSVQVVGDDGKTLQSLLSPSSDPSRQSDGCRF